jgi:putative peptidoglycan lipid II flippase
MYKKLLSLLSGKTESIGLAAVIIGAASVTSRIIGVFRDRLLSGTFGAGLELDAYYAAFRFPDFMFNLIVLGAIGAGFVPVMSAYLAKDRDSSRPEAASWQFVQRLVTVFGVTLVVVSLLAIALAPTVVPLITPGLPAEYRRVAADLTRIMFVGGPLLGVSSLLGGVLQSHRRFMAYAVAPVVYNLGIMVGVFFFAGRWGIYGAAWGVLLGIVGHFAIQLASAHGAGFRFRWRWAPRDPGLRELVTMATPRIAALGLGQLNLMIVTGLATTLGAGAVAVFNFANNLQSFPVSVIGISLAVASFPVVADLAARGRLRDLAAEFNKSARAILYLTVPATVLFLLLRAQIVRVALGTGAFDWHDTVATADALALFVISLFAQALLPLLTRTFFALRDVKTTLLAALSGVAAERVAAAALLHQGMGVGGLVLALSLGAMLNLTLLWVLLRRRLGPLGEGRLLRDLALMSAAGAAAAITIQGTKVLVAGVVDMQTFVGVMAQASAAGALGLAVYVGLTYWFGLGEARGYLLRAWRRTRRLGGRWPFRRKQVDCHMTPEEFGTHASGHCGRIEK